jgi:hypothetical protein
MDENVVQRRLRGVYGLWVRGINSLSAIPHLDVGVECLLRLPVDELVSGEDPVPWGAEGVLLQRPQLPFLHLVM